MITVNFTSINPPNINVCLSHCYIIEASLSKLNTGRKSGTSGTSTNTDKWYEHREFTKVDLKVLQVLPDVYSSHEHLS